MNSLLLALSRIPGLESFKLDSLPRLSSTGNQSAQEEYRLPRLRKLQLRMMDEGVADFLTRLELPRTASVHFFAEPSDLPRDVEDRADIPESIIIEGLTRTSVKLLQGAFPYAVFHRGRPSELWRDVALNCAKLWTWIAWEERLDFPFIDSLIERTLNLPLTYVHTVNPDIAHCISCVDEESFEAAFGATKPHLNPQQVDGHQNIAISHPKLRSLDFTGPELAGHYLAKFIEPLSPDATLRYALGRHCALPKSTLVHLAGAAGGFLRTYSVHTVSYGTQKSSVVEGLGGNQLLTSAHLWAAPTTTVTASDADAQQATQSLFPDRSRCAKRAATASPSLILDGMEKKLLAATLQRLDLSRMRTAQIMGFDEADAWADALKNAHEVTMLRAVSMAAFGLPATLAAGIRQGILYDAPDGFMVLGLLEATVRRRIGGARGRENDEATAAAWYWTGFWDAKERESAGEDDAIESTAAHAHGPALFPKLEVIQLVDVDFAARAPLQGMETERTARASEEVLERFTKKGANYGFHFAAMLKALRVRRAQGASDVVRVEFENCSSTTALEDG
ncbi:hypothetical protein GSI_00597 [Ganoderma sinense ZZ0214-1]|uniref:Uncharacterized protein n=1 Tax=Ganoderma sinense ZZ0214-1 TaxID=1077348 RepID=A0A2G8ST01_9APHY|nr:hypothetical protein GSI_00597 [Ganoderma sinense ZZ0214-1]